MKVAEFFPRKSNLDAQPEACSQHVVESLLKLNTFSHRSTFGSGRGSSNRDKQQSKTREASSETIIFFKQKTERLMYTAGIYMNSSH